jgi:hypothetical protein
LGKPVFYSDVFSGVCCGLYALRAVCAAQALKRVALALPVQCLAKAPGGDFWLGQRGRLWGFVLAPQALQLFQGVIAATLSNT